jgi:RHH-type proline utilization regulon transcriptional repressor/proline dehydrogenase/delta 1-pyrroline-5-carboxylate dehydrogenase
MAVVEEGISPHRGEAATSADIAAMSLRSNGTLAPAAQASRQEIATATLEADTQARGRKLLAAMRRQERRVRLSDWFYDRLMEVTTRDDALKVELFRFVDALPALKTDASVARHLQEYLVRPDITLPPRAGWLLDALSSNGATRHVLSFASHTGAKQMARRFIAGRDAHEATAAIERLHREHRTFTLDLLGEAVTSESEALAYQARYLELLRDLGRVRAGWRRDPQIDTAPWGDLPRVNVSVKLSSLYARFDPMAADETAAAVKERLRPVFQLARANGAFVNVDMEQHDFCVITQRIFREVCMEPEFRDWPDIGIVVQAYLRNSSADLAGLRDWVHDVRGTPVWVRLVKGAYWDYETIVAAQRGHPAPVFSHKRDTDANYEACTAFLVDNWETLRPAIASHNVRSVAHAQAAAAARGLPPRAVEYQVLYGMGDGIGRALAAQGERVRVYVPFGELLPGMAYLVRRLLENTAND